MIKKALKNKKLVYNTLTFLFLFTGIILLIKKFNIGLFFLAAGFHFGLKSGIEDLKSQIKQ